MGARVQVTPMERVEFALFGEAPSRILLTTQDPEAVGEIALRYDVECPVIGVTMKGRLQIGNEATMWIDLPTADLKQSFETSLPAFFDQRMLDKNAG
jgi:hypothetical protein